MPKMKDSYKDIMGFDPLTSPIAEQKIKEVYDVAMKSVSESIGFIVFAVNKETKYSRTIFHNVPGNMFRPAMEHIISSYGKIMKEAEIDSKTTRIAIEEAEEFRL